MKKYAICPNCNGRGKILNISNSIDAELDRLVDCAGKTYDEAKSILITRYPNETTTCDKCGGSGKLEN